jgi:hypothetical protein
MTIFNFTLGASTFEVIFSEEKYDEDIVGECGFEFPPETIRALEPLVNKKPISWSYAHEYVEIALGEGRYALNVADCLIEVLYLCGTLPNHYTFWYFGNPYWLFHDVIHAGHDVSDNGVHIGELEEAHALLEGAKLALANGVSLSIIVRALASTEKEYRERFSSEPTALDSFLEYYENQVQVQV